LASIGSFIQYLTISGQSDQYLTILNRQQDRLTMFERRPLHRLRDQYLTIYEPTIDQYWTISESFD
jgi:hypothetical protein